MRLSSQEVFFMDVEASEDIRLECYKLGKGKPLVFLRGSGGIRNQAYPDFIEKLSKYYTVYSFTYPGFGKSSRMGDWTDKNFNDLLLQFVNKLGLSTFTIIGYSIGSAIALNFALEHPNTVTKIITVCPITTPLVHSRIKAVWLAYRESLKGQKNLDKHKRDFPASSYSLKTYIPKKAFNDLYKYLKRIDLRASLPKINIPTHVFIGGQDKLIDVPSEIANAKLLPNTKTTIFEDEGHYLLVNKVDEIITKL